MTLLFLSFFKVSNNEDEEDGWETESIDDLKNDPDFEIDHREKALVMKNTAALTKTPKITVMVAKIACF